MDSNKTSTLNATVFALSILAIGYLSYRRLEARSKILSFALPASGDLKDSNGTSTDKKNAAKRKASLGLSGLSSVKREKAKTFQEQHIEKYAAQAGKKPVSDSRGESGKGGPRLMKNASISEIRIHDIVSLRESFPSADVDNYVGNQFIKERSSQAITYNKILGLEDYVLKDIVRKNEKVKDRMLNESNKLHECEAYVRAGPRSHTHFNPTEVRAAIVTCGGLCPGLNNVVRELCHALYYLYQVKSVLGIRGGYHGFDEKSGDAFAPVELTLDFVENCHHQGGTILASSRGGFDEEIILQFLQKHQINQLYVIGGDGTHRGANKISELCIQRGLNVSVVGIPKTIDNDVDLIDRSFGFTTSVEEAQAAIRAAKTEARCNLPNGIGIVKLMGRSAGFIAVHATLASGDVDLCLVPEVKMELDGERGCLPFLLRRVRENGHAVVVVAEGAGEEVLGTAAEVDAGGNKKLPPIGEFLKNKVNGYFKQAGMEATVKYIDPSYMIRSVPANASDSLYCMLLAHNAVHGAMAGYTAFSVGLVNNRVVYIPITRLVATSPRVMDPVGRTWERVLAMTRQPNTKPTFDYQHTSVNDRTTC